VTFREKIKEKLRPGQVLNHSSKALLVIENSSGTEPIAHLLEPKRKSPPAIDADGFRRADGKTVFGHTAWWKIFNGTAIDIWQIGSDVLVPTSLMIPVSGQHFGSFSIDKTSGWGSKLKYVTARIINKKGKVTGYLAEGIGRISKKQAIQLTKSGDLDNVIVVQNQRGTPYLRTKKNLTMMDNLSA
jgi:hypothetical protein